MKKLKKEITEDEGVTPDVLEIVLLKEIASRIADLQTVIESQNNGKNKKKRSVPVMRHIPYNIRRTLRADGRRTELIKTDTSMGLKTVGRAGYIYNDGPGSIQIKIYDGNNWTDWITIASCDGINFYYEDNIWIERMKIKGDKILAATYELTMNPGLGGTE